MKMRELGLDPNDTTPHELYKALVNLAALHDSFLANRLAISEPHDPRVVLPAVTRIVNGWHIPKAAWVLKPVAIKKLLKAVPAKNLMKELHYRSLDSMIKREPAQVLLTVARHIETATWQQKMLDAYKKLLPSDFETQNIAVEYLDSPRWQEFGEALARARRTNVMHAPEAGVVLVLPLPVVELRGLTLMSLLLILHWIQEIRVHSTYFKFQHMQPNFGKLLSKSLSGNDGGHVRLGGQPIHWRVVHRYYGQANRLNHPEIFEPHVQPEDLAYRKAEALLYRLEPALHFWHNLDYVGLPQADDKPLSFNLLDNAINLLNGLDYEQRVSYHLRDAVWNEFYSRYMGERALERELLEQLDHKVIGEHEAVRDLEFVW
jgi:hypothetical protein